MTGTSDVPPAEPLSSPEPSPLAIPKRARLNFWAILLGTAVDVVLTYAGGLFILTLVFVWFEDQTLLVLLLFGLAMTAFGGYVAAAVAGRRSLAHGLGVGVLSLASGVVLERLTGGESALQLPLWFDIVGYGLTIPAGGLGGWVRRRFWGERLTIPAPRPGLYPNLRQAVWLLILSLVVTLLVAVAVGLVVQLALRGRGGITRWAVPAVLIGAAAGEALILVWAVRRARAPLAEVFPFRRVHLGRVWPAALTVGGAAILFSELVNVIHRAFAIPQVPIDPNNLFGGLEGMFWATVVFVVVLGPVAEELLFRGVILRGFLSRYTTRKAIVISAALFGVVHVNPLQFPVAMVLGMLFAWWRVRTGSLALPLSGHALYNSLILTFPRLTPGAAPSVIEIEAGWLLQPLWLDLTGVALFLVGILQFARATRGNLPPQV